jgi:cytochrome P450
MATRTADPRLRGSPPGPRAHPLLGVLPEFRRDPLGFVLGCARQYGDVVRLRFPVLTFYLVSHPDAIEEILVTQHRDVVKGLSYRSLLRSFLGNGLLTSEGEYWRRQRRLIQPAFHRDHIASYVETMAAYADRMVRTWGDGETRDLHTDLRRLTLQIVTKVLFGAEIERETADVGRALGVVTERALRFISAPVPLPLGIPTPGNVRYHRAVRRLDQIVYGIIRARRAGGAAGGDLLSVLLRAQDEDGSRMTDRQLRDEVITLFLAGHETTALALAWTFYLLSEHPDADAALAAEAGEVLGDRVPAVTDLPRLCYAQQVVREAMRIFPPVWGIEREARQDLTVGGYRLPRGAQILISQYVVHRDPRWYAEPERFRPERWADGTEQQRPRYAYFPFGGGPRLCIGHEFAMTEAVLVLASIVRRFRLRVAPGHPVAPLPSITLQLKHGLRAVVSRR